MSIPEGEMTELEHKQLQAIYRWIDKIPLSRPKRNIARDFADGVLMSEVVAHFFPKMVELHNYSKSNSVTQKQYNWATLNQKVFRRMGFTVPQDDVTAVVECSRGAIEKVLLFVQEKMSVYAENLKNKPAEEKEKPTAKPAPKAAAAPPAAVPAPAAHAAAAAPAAKPKKAAAASPTNAARGEKKEKKLAQNGRSSSASEKSPAAAPRTVAAAPAAAVSAGAGAGPSAAGGGASAAELARKDQIIADLTDTVDILQKKVDKLEQLLKLKNTKIDNLTKKMSEMQMFGAGGAGGGGFEV